MHEETLHSKTVFAGKLIQVDVLDVELACGRRTVREIIQHPGAAVILAQLPDKQFVWVRQYRKAVEEELLEVVAGTLDPDEAPEACARRELKEETGYDAQSLEALGVIFPAPGYSQEVMYIYFAALLPERGASQPDDDEKLDVVFLTETEIEAMIKKGDIRDAKTLAAWALYRRKR